MTTHLVTGLMRQHSILSRIPCRSKWTFAAFVLTTSLLVGLRPAPAHASEGYAQAWGGLMLARANPAGDTAQWGAGAQFGLLAGITDFWSILGGVETGYLFATTRGGESPQELPSAQILGLFAGFRYNLDLFTYVPYVGLAIENYIIAPPKSPGITAPNIGARLSVGVDWRFSRRYSVGAQIQLHTAVDDPANFPIYSTLGVHLSYHFRL